MTLSITSSFQLVLRDKSGALSPTEKLVLATIADTCNPSNGWTGWPSLQYLSQTTGFSVRAISNAIKSLNSKGVLNIESGHTGKCNVYTINIGKLDKDAKLC